MLIREINLAKLFVPAIINQMFRVIELSIKIGHAEPVLGVGNLWVCFTRCSLCPSCLATSSGQQYTYALRFWSAWTVMTSSPANEPKPN